MDFKEALHKALRADKHTHSNPFLLHSRVCDLVGSDYAAKKAAEEFYRLDAKYEISKSILSSIPRPRRKKRKKYLYRYKPMPIPPDEAYVFFSSDSQTLHLSGECPCLKKKGYFFRNTYKWARFRQYQARYGYSSHIRAESEKVKIHPTKICRYCGDFTPQIAHGLLHRVFLFLYEWFGIEPREKVIFPIYRNMRL